MSFAMKCPDCAQDLTVPAHAVGANVQCPGCQRLFLVAQADPHEDDALRWYAGVGDSAQGPMDRATLRQMISSGQVDAATLVWNESMADWAPAGTVASVAPLVEAAARQASAPAPDPGQSSTVDTPVQPTPRTQPDGACAASRETAPVQTTPTSGSPGDDWHWVDVRGNMQGPVTQHDMRVHISSGHLTSETLVWRPSWSQWKPMGGTELAQTPGEGERRDERERVGASRVPIQRLGPTPARQGLGLWKRALRADLLVLFGATALILCGPLPWVQVGGVGVSGFDTSGMWLFLFGIAQVTLVVIAVREDFTSTWNAWATRALAILSTIIAGMAFTRIVLRASDTISIRAMEVVVTNLTPGLGLIVGMMGAVAVLVGSFAPALAGTQNWARALLQPATRQSAQTQLARQR